MVCDYHRGHGGDRGGAAGAIRSKAVSPGFDFERDLTRVGIANQTTMLSGESLAIAEEVRRSMARRYGDAAVADHFRSFDTICSATQERQDAVVALMEEPLDVMVVVGGYNSSNTCHLAALVQSRGIRVYHIEDADAVDALRRRSATSRSARSRRSGSDGLARRRPDHRHHGRRLDPEQQDRRDDRADLPDGRGRVREALGRPDGQ